MAISEHAMFFYFVEAGIKNIACSCEATGRGQQGPCIGIPLYESEAVGTSREIINIARSLAGRPSE